MSRTNITGKVLIVCYGQFWVFFFGGHLDPTVASSKYYYAHFIKKKQNI